MGSMLVCCQALGFPLHCRGSPRALPAAMGAATFGDRVPYEFQASFIPGLPHQLQRREPRAAVGVTCGVMSRRMSVTISIRGSLQDGLSKAAQWAPAS